MLLCRHDGIGGLTRQLFCRADVADKLRRRASEPGDVQQCLKIFQDDFRFVRDFRVDEFALQTGVKNFSQRRRFASDAEIARQKTQADIKLNRDK